MREQKNLYAEFRLIDQQKQFRLLYQSGIYIGKRQQEGVISLLYQYESIYVEIVYAVYRQHVAQVHYYNNTWILDFYLPSDTMILSGLLLKK